MIEWEESRIISQNIDQVWSLFADRNIRKIMPQVQKHELIEKNEQEAGAKHMQSSKEGWRIQKYVVETLAYEDLPDKKYKQIYFVPGRAVEIDLCFTLYKIDENQTQFTYAGCSQGRNFVGQAIMKLASHSSNLKTVHKFLDRVETEAMKL
ncbi:SRPBCC family protein [Planococcus salinarum]|uniref:SRPBCC family protein n=1 Tax=Planococcus salinarum TaxID=622695 RepID=UPI000E3BDBA6|nr:SRPBCC family protein [Planococcus salinarum]TAA72695.1 SRPBCC family protein [Planococcus salinarum]